ncbi:MAG: DUF1501 domain-containing protein [Saprospiraceae bacterium]|nr:DUF1501 domain-containing protein [Saprospiraceae bacterium]
MKRRTFLQHTSTAAVTLPLVLNGNKLSAFTQHALFKGMQQDSDKVLVLIQMNGGNDGLNMVLPLDQYSNLFLARENILIPETSALKLTDKTGLHPAMSGLHQTYMNGQLAVFQGVGYPNQNRSHFRSTDIWQSASGATEVINTGWLGRHFDDYAVGYPDGYPNAQYPDPFAITIGSTVNETCQGNLSNYSLALTNPFGLSPLLEDDDTTSDPTQCYGKEIAFVRTSIAQTNAYSEVITAAAEQGANMVEYEADNNLAGQLKTIALLISGGLKTRVYIANIGGFDTHANQVNIGDTTTGGHATLLNRLSEAITLFQQDLTAQKLDQRVVGMTFSEFGRRIKSNGANGTDHGSAAPLFVFGSCVNSRIFGQNPTITDNVGDQEGLAMQIDFRSIYGSLLNQWFGVPTADVKALLNDAYSEIPLIRGCETKEYELDPDYAEPVDSPFNNSPNPFTGSTQITFQSAGERVHLSVMNSGGYTVSVLVDKYLEAGNYTVPFDASGLPRGNYFAYLRTPKRQQSLTMIMQR